MRMTSEQYEEWSKERRPWSPNEIEVLKEAYSDPSKYVDIHLLALRLGRSYAGVAIKVSKLGLSNTTPKRDPDDREARSETVKKVWANRTPEEAKEAWKHLIPYFGKSFLGKTHTPEAKAAISVKVKKAFEEQGHPKGMLGKHHSAETKRVIGEKSKGREVPPEQTLRSMKACFKKYGNGNMKPPVAHGSWKAAWRDIGDRRIFARSRWEANYARFLEFRKSQKEILDWEHEGETFWFEKIRRGCRSYLPDFTVTLLDGTKEYHEVKGWMDARSKTKLKRMAKYHPTIQIKLVQKDWFQANKNLAKILPGWESATDASAVKP